MCSFHCWSLRHKNDANFSILKKIHCARGVTVLELLRWVSIQLMETFVFLVHAYEIGERYIIERRDALTFCSFGNSVSHCLLSWLWSDLSSLSNEPVHTLTELALLFTIKSQFEGKSLTNCLCLPRSREDRFHSCFDSSKLWLLLLLAQKLRRWIVYGNTYGIRKRPCIYRYDGQAVARVNEHETESNVCLAWAKRPTGYVCVLNLSRVSAHRLTDGVYFTNFKSKQTFLRWCARWQKKKDHDEWPYRTF